MKELGDKASHAFKNMGKAKNLEDIPQTIANAGGKVGQVEGMTSKFGNTLSKLGKAVPVVAGIAAMAPTLSKASEGDYKGAALEAGNSALDMSPLGTLKSAISADPVNDNEEQLLEDYRRKNETPDTKRFNKIRNIMESR